MFGNVTPPTPRQDAAPYIQNKEDEGGGHKGKEDKEKVERKIAQDNEDITIILSNWIFNQN